MDTRLGLAAFAALALAGCSTGGGTSGTTGSVTTTTTAGTETYSGFISRFLDDDDTLSAQARQALSLDNMRIDTVANASVGSVVMVTGSDADGVEAHAGVSPVFDVGTTTTAGTATYEADYRVIHLADGEAITTSPTVPLLSGDTTTWIPGGANGTVELAADFGAGTLEGSDRQLEVAGQILSNNVSGAVLYRGTAGTLDGKIGSTGVVAAFQGNDSDLTYAGGLVGEAAP